jgi:hypothetical protein
VGSSSQRSQFDLKANSAGGANDSVLLTSLVIVFALAVSGVVIVAGRRAGRRSR